MREPNEIKDSLEKEILGLIQTFERDYNIFFKSIKSKKDRDGFLVGITVGFDEELDVLTVLTRGESLRDISVEAMDKIREAALVIDVERCLEMSLGEILGVDIFELIEKADPSYSFKSLKTKKDKGGRLIGITVNFDED